MADYDVIVIGGGAAGLTVAVGGGLMGMRVLLVERDRTGGECTWMGCVPSKALLHAAKVAAAARQAAAWSADGAAPPQIDFAKAIAHMRGARVEVSAVETPEALRQRYGITVLQGTARLRGGGVVEVDGQRPAARHIVVATGSDPELPPVLGLGDTRYLTNETLFDEVDTLPARLAVIGGGPIGCEMTQAFARLGSSVTLIQSRDRLLVNDDPDAGPLVKAALERDGARVLLNARLSAVTPVQKGGRAATLTVEGQPPIEADAVLVAAGRRARTKSLGLEEAGVQLGRNGVVVDEHLQTSVPGIWALGDVVDPYRFTHVAEMQGRVVVRNIMFPWKKSKVDYRVVPWATFTDPEVGHVGLTEAQAQERYGRAVSVVTLPLSAVDRAVTEGATEGYIKLVLRRWQIVGGHIVSPNAGELIQQVAMAMKRNVRIGAFSMIHCYPTYAYGLHQAADRHFSRHVNDPGLGRAIFSLVRRLSLGH